MSGYIFVLLELSAPPGSNSHPCYFANAWSCTVIPTLNIIRVSHLQPRWYKTRSRSFDFTFHITTKITLSNRSIFKFLIHLRNPRSSLQKKIQWQTKPKFKLFSTQAKLFAKFEWVKPHIPPMRGGVRI